MVYFPLGRRYELQENQGDDLQNLEKSLTPSGRLEDGICESDV